MYAHRQNVLGRSNAYFDIVGGVPTQPNTTVSSVDERNAVQAVIQCKQLIERIAYTSLEERFCFAEIARIDPRN